MKNLRDFSNYINESEDSNYAPVTIKKFNEFVNGVEEDAVKAGEDSDVVIDDITLDSGEEIKGAEILGVIIDSETEKEFKDFETLVSNKEKLLGTKINPELNLKKNFIEKLTISKPSPINVEIKKIDIKKLDSDQTFENQFSDLLDDFDSREEENQYVDLDKSKSIREQLIRKNEISQNLIQRFSEFLGSRIINQINAGRWETNIVLRPERLGKLNVKINLDNGEFKANFSTSNSVSRDILIEAIPKLKLNLENSGMNVASVNVEVFTSSDKNQGNQKNYILNQELNRTDRTDSEDEVMDTVSVQKINFSVDGIDIVI